MGYLQTALIAFGAIAFILVWLLGIYYATKLFCCFAAKGKKSQEKKKPEKKRYITYTKRWFNIILSHAIIWVDLSYVLAFMDKAQIAETLSEQAVGTIIGAFVTYCLKSAYEKKIGKEKEEYENVNEEIYQ